jgi:hypothetical protein
MRRDEQQRIEELEQRVEAEARSLGGSRGVKLLSNPSECFLATFIGPGLPPSPSQKRFRAKAFVASRKSSSRGQARTLRHVHRSSPARPLAAESFSMPFDCLPHEARHDPVASR